MSTLVNLWPEEIVYQRVKAPVAILREQAAMLGKLTKNLVQGEVAKPYSLKPDKSFAYNFFITAPSLGEYRYQLLVIEHDVDLYPVSIHIEEAIFSEIHNAFESNTNKIIAKSEKQFLEALQAIFTAKKTAQVITALLSQVDPDWVIEAKVMG